MDADLTYLQMIQAVRSEGSHRADRTGVGTLSKFSHTATFDLTQGFPILKGKRIHWKSVVGELLWFLSGSTLVKDLQGRGVRIWDEWEKEDGTIGPGYSAAWRRWEGAGGKVVDQIAEVIEQIKTNPSSRRLIVNAWNVAELENMALPPCHMFFQFYVDGENLDMQMYQRSADLFLGVPFNISSYALLLSMVAQVTGLKPRNLHMVFGDLHIYDNHHGAIDKYIDQLTEVNASDTVGLRLNPEIRNIDDFTEADIALLNYNPQPTIKATVAV